MSVDSMIDPPPAPEVDRFVGRLDSTLGGQWAPAAPKWVARAPGRLDVMGGFAEFTGSLTLSYPVAAGVLMAAAPRDDQQIVVCALNPEGNGSTGEYRLPLARFYTDGEGLLDPTDFATSFGDCKCHDARDVAGLLYTLLERQAVPHLGGGVTIGVRSELTGLVGVASRAATTLAALLALARVYDLAYEAGLFTGLVCRSLNQIWSRAQGVADPMAVLLSQSGGLLQVRCQTNEVLGSLPIPASVALTGIECRACHAAADTKYLDARVAAFMGRNIIARILAAESTPAPRWNGFLSQLTIADYVERLRDRLPTKITGRDFVDRFGESGDPLTRIEPQKTYKVRSRTEHHIYENARAHQFAERLARAARTQDRQAILEAGELMYASHWSYGQRCGLGSIETDRMVTLLRKQGLDAGIFGAKISARGAGGTVVVLHADTEEARQAIRQAIDLYASRTNVQPLLLTGTSPGAQAWGTHRIG